MTLTSPCSYASRTLPLPGAPNWHTKDFLSTGRGTSHPGSRVWCFSLYPFTSHEEIDPHLLWRVITRQNRLTRGRHTGPLKRQRLRLIPRRMGPPFSRQPTGGETSTIQSSDRDLQWWDLSRYIKRSSVESHRKSVSGLLTVEVRREGME